MKQNGKNSFWTQKTHLFKSDEYICSSCGYSASKPYKSCPSCHADMKRTSYDPSWVDDAELLDIILGD